MKRPRRKHPPAFKARVARAEDTHPVQAGPPEAPDHPLRRGMLPGTLRGGADVGTPHAGTASLTAGAGERRKRGRPFPRGLRGAHARPHRGPSAQAFC
jgi:hypothetical protein